MVIHVATRSLIEVFLASMPHKDGNIPTRCEMCTELIFPISVFIESLDPRPPVKAVDPDDKEYHATDLVPIGITDEHVPPLCDEGWKMMVGAGQFLGRFKEGRHLFERDNFFDRDASRSLAKERPVVGATSLELGYLRSTSPLVPNYVGLGFVFAPGVRTSVYPLSIGYWFPNEITPKNGGFYEGVRLNVGMRVDEAFSFLNPESDDLVSGEATVVFDIGYKFKRPLFTPFFRWELVTGNLRGNIRDLEYTIDSPFHNGAGAYTIGIRYDLSEVYK